MRSNRGESDLIKPSRWAIPLRNST
jgi:hypothetical protein